MNKPTTLLLATAALLGALAEARVASAQRDVNPQPPNVMLLVDTSGSMEFKTSSTQPPKCDPLGSASDNERSRWVDLVEVLTGGITNYRCDAVDRNSATFKAEYLLGSTPSPDYQYIHPYHRPLSGTCAIGPGTMGLNAYDFPSTALKFHLYNSSATPCSTFQQTNDGILDAFASRVRFGLMTFDTHIFEGTGVSGTTADPADGVDGAWSYYVGQPAEGMPAGCTVPEKQEVGARNAAAPPWEGRMIAFGNPTATAAVLSAKNQQIQQVLLASRPYGATPIAGMMDDALKFFWEDATKDPLISADDFGPKNDPFIEKGCRDSIIVLITDGEPNLDLRPYCEAAGGLCPYEKKPEQTADLLAHPTNGNKPVRTFVIGLALSEFTLTSGAAFDCKKKSDLDPSALDSPTSPCVTMPNEPGVQACCTLHRIAFNGDTDNAHFADTNQAIRNALSEAMSQIMPVTSRTVPVFATTSSPTGGNGSSFRFFSSFKPQQFDVWSGVLERQRFECKKVDGVFQAEPQPIDPDQGDDFVFNVNAEGDNAAEERRFFSVNGDLDVTAIHSTRSIRPHLASGAADGAGNYSGTPTPIAPGAMGAASFVPQVNPKAMAITTGTCTGLTDAQCRDRFMKWNVGVVNDEQETRCRTATDCNLIGDIFHSTPAVVSRPSAFLRDETYDEFAATHASRPLVMYTSTNDGFLHAFQADVKTRENNELWAFIPPAVLPEIRSQYPKVHMQLLDGVPVVKDVVAKLGPDGVNYTFERGIVAARGREGTWRTVLVQGFGAGRGGYFALDVTDPVITDDNKGPRFLWQLTTDAAGSPLFGRGGATPLITTVLLTDDSGTKEVAVAVLPGGAGPAPTAGPLGTGCQRDTTDLSVIDSAYPPRQRVNCYDGDGIQGRSLTIVRLDSGEILQTFRQQESEVPAGVNAVTPDRVEIVKDLLSPITGPPVAFPGQAGAVADRVFVGDADGTLWRVDLSSPKPEDWEMRIFWDAYPGGSQPNHVFNQGHPIMIPPVLSVNNLGEVTVAMATGDQEVLTAPSGMVTYLWSITEKIENGKLIARPNWYLGGDSGTRQFVNGERVTGPISLFNGGLYFSTFTPAPESTDDVCLSGGSRVWGVDYIERDEAGDIKSGGKRLLVKDPEANPLEPVQFLTPATNPDIPADAVIFGASVVQLPTCFDNLNPTGDEDPYTGATGTHTSITNVTPGNFQLVMHTGDKGSAVPGGISRVASVDLTSPTAVARIDSWASIVE